MKKSDLRFLNYSARGTTNYIKKMHFYFDCDFNFDFDFNSDFNFNFNFNFNCEFDFDFDLEKIQEYYILTHLHISIQSYKYVCC